MMQTRKNIFINLLLLICSLSIGSNLSHAQDIKSIGFTELESRINSTSEKVTVFNFWATWCKPCVAEIPALLTFCEKNKLELVLVSLDFENEIEKVKGFAKRKEIKNEIVLLNEPDYDSWISKVDETWNGAIPATLFINKPKEQKAFYEGELNEIKLKEILTKLTTK